MLQGKNALVTGGGRGIGRAIATRLAREGARVVVTGRTENEIASVAAEIGGIAIPMDAGDRKSSDEAVVNIEKAVGRIDILVNNAGISHSAPLAKTSDADWDRVMEINCNAPFRLTRALVPAMIKAGWGRVINIASNAGVIGYGYGHPYCASKHAVVGFTKSLAIDLAKTPVTINVVCPGWVETRMATEAMGRIVSKTGRSEQEIRSSIEQLSPQQRLLDPSEVAHIVAMLCADEARGMHGQTIVIDGGQTMR